MNFLADEHPPYKDYKGESYINILSYYYFPEVSNLFLEKKKETAQ